MPLLLDKMKQDAHFRMKTFLCISYIFNVVYSLFLFVVSYIASSQWFFIMSLYYGLLSVARIFIFKQIDPLKTERSKIITMRTCGCFLFLINFVVSILMFILIYGNHYVKHHEITVITLATYTFSALTVAIVSSVQRLKKKEYVYSCVKIISLISASVSLVTLTNTMLITFGEDNLLLRSIVLPLLSGFVAVFIIVSAILMIYKANLELRILNHEKE